MSTIDCTYCSARHGQRFLCEPAKKLLDGMQARARSYDMPTLAFDSPLFEGAEGKVLLVQLVAKAAVIVVSGVPHPVLLITGRTPNGGIAPTLMFGASAVEMRRALKLIADMGDLALERAAGGWVPDGD